MNAVVAESADEATESGRQKFDFEAFVACEQRRVYLLCLRLLRDRDEADSATQDAFVEAHRAMEKAGVAAIREPATPLPGSGDHV